MVPTSGAIHITRSYIPSFSIPEPQKNMHMHKSLLFLFWAMASILAGCGTRVDVETAHVGRVMTTSGLDSELKTPSSFRLAVDFFGGNPSRLIVIETSDQQKEESLSVFMPKDKLVLTFDVRGVFAIPSTKEATDAIFERIVPEPVPDHDRVYRIDFDQVYGTYAKREVLVVARQVITQHDIAFVMSHREEVSRTLLEKLREHLKGTPIQVMDFNLSSTQPPDVIVKAEAVSKGRQIAIKEAEATRMVKITEAEGRLAVAKKQQMIDLVHADTSRQVAMKLTLGVNPAFVQQRTLNILDGLSDNRVLIVPDEALQDPAMKMAINQHILQATATGIAPEAAKKN